MAVRRASLASRTAAERAAVIAIQDDRLDRLALLEAEALPLLSDMANGTLDPADSAVRERCARNAATLRRALVDRAEQAGGVLAGLAPALDAAQARGLEVQVQVVGDPGRPGPAVTRATLGAVHGVLRSLPGPPVTLTILAVGGNVELYLTFDQAPACRWDLAALAAGCPAGGRRGRPRPTPGTAVQGAWRSAGGSREEPGERPGRLRRHRRGGRG